mgnify:CR=1 FL=1
MKKKVQFITEVDIEEKKIPVKKPPVNDNKSEKSNNKSVKSSMKEEEATSSIASDFSFELTQDEIA